MSSIIADPKLKQARSEIEAILERYDIAGVVTLHNADQARREGRAEHFYRLTPSYSKLTQVGNGQFRLRSMLADYGGDAAARRSDLAATASMTHNLATLVGTAAIELLQLAAFVDEQLGSVHTPPRLQPDPPKGAH